MSQSSNPENKKKSQGFNPFSILFPFFAIFGVVKDASSLHQFFKKDGDPISQESIQWINSVARRNTAAGMSLIIALIVSIACLILPLNLKGVDILNKKKVKSNISYLKNEVVRAHKEKIAFRIGEILFGAYLVFGNLLVLSHPHISLNRKFKKKLAETSINPKNMGSSFITPAGIVLNITGNSIQEMVNQEALWNALNMSVTKDSAVQSMKDKSMVLFRPSLELKEIYALSRKPEKK